MSNPGQAGLCPHNPLLVKVMPCTSCACCSRCDACKDNAIFSAGFKVFHCPGISTALLPVGAHYAALFPGRGSSSCLLIQLSRCSYSSANHPGGLLPGWEFTLRDCCAIMATIGICAFCCRPLDVSNLGFLFVWRIDIICFRNSYCRIGGAKNE